MDFMSGPATSGGNCEISPQPEIFWFVSIFKNVLLPTGNVLNAEILIAEARSSPWPAGFCALVVSRHSIHAAAAALEEVSKFRRLIPQEWAPFFMSSGFWIR